MARHRMIVRQWKLLLALDASRNGLTFRHLIDRLYDETCSSRTVRRDVDALILAGFPIEVRTRGEGMDHTNVIVLDRAEWRGGERTVFGRAGATH